MLDTQSTAKIASHIRDLPGGQSMSDHMLTGSDEWSSIAELLFFCSGFPSIEFNALHSSAEFDIRWPLTYSAWYFGSSGGSVEIDCIEFVVGIHGQRDAKNALNEYIGPQWLDTWKARLLTLLEAEELPNNPMDTTRRIGRLDF